MNLFEKAVALLTFFKSPGRGYQSFTESEMTAALKNSLQWFENVLNDDRLPASSYSLLLDQLNGPSARTAAHWLETMVLLMSSGLPDNSHKESACKHAATLAEWLVSIQRKDGTWPVGSNDYKNRPPSVFQTGIILNALIIYSEKTGAKPEISKAIENGLQWLLTLQNENGGWDEYIFGKHLICTNTAALLIRTGMYLNDAAIVQKGKKAIDYYFSFQIGNGFFYFLPAAQKDYFASDYGFILHGFSNAASLLNNRLYAEKVWHGIKPLLHSGKGQWMIPGIINYEFNAPVNYYSLFGSVMAVLTVMLIYPLLQLNEIIQYAHSLAHRIASSQLQSENKRIHGGFAVSQPSSGGYKPYEISGDAIALYAKALLMLLTLQPKPGNLSDATVVNFRTTVL
jgi:hypothetical protein